MRNSLATIIGACLLALWACGSESGAGDAPPLADPGPAPVPFDSGRVRLVSGDDTVLVRVEIARDDAQRAYGLMERTSLPDDAGMLFLYPEPQPAESGFWMFRTRIPLDIAFVDPQGIIRAIRPMEPCESPYPQWCPAYPAGVAYQSALEANRGFFAARGIEPGDRLEVLPPAP